MSAEDPVQVWVVNPKGQFVPQEEPDCCCSECQAEDEGPEIEMIFEDDPESICPACGEPILKGHVTVPMTFWGDVYENQADDYPMVGQSRPVHIECLAEAIKDQDDSKR
jgi:hypothetical protein